MQSLFDVVVLHCIVHRNKPATSSAPLRSGIKNVNVPSWIFDFFLFLLSYILSRQLLWFSVTSLLSLLSIRVTNHNYFCLQSLRCPRSDWTCLCIDGLNDVCAPVCPVVYIPQSMRSFGCFCFPLFYISMDFPFNLGQHCGGRQGIDFCPMGLTGTRISPSSWGFTAGCDSAQSIALNLSANLLANQSNLNIILRIPSWLTWTLCAPSSRERMEAGKKKIFVQRKYNI